MVYRSVFDRTRKEALHSEKDFVAATQAATSSVTNEKLYGSLAVWKKSADFAGLDIDPFKKTIEEGHDLLAGKVCATDSAGK